MVKDYFIEYLLKCGLIEFYGEGKEDWKLSQLGKIFCSFIFFDYMRRDFENSEFYKNLKKEGKI